jgi:hypothetical protein
MNLIVKRNLSFLIKEYGFKDINLYDKFLYDNNFCLSGSFLLQAISGENWKGSDMDIYVEKKNIKNAQKYQTILKEMQYCEISDDEYTYDYDVLESEKTQIGLFEVKTFRKYIFHKPQNIVKTIQIIYVSHELNTFVDHFDFDFVKAMYKPYIDSLGQQVSDSLLRKMVLHIPTHVIKSIIHKLSNIDMRRFDLSHTGVYTNNSWFTLIQRIIVRVNKYKYRGYTIIHPLHWVNLNKLIRFHISNHSPRKACLLTKYYLKMTY